jgi:hypothetical protein
MRKINKKGQEEMVGFGLIMILVAVILLVFLSFSIRNSNKSGAESYQVENFIQSFLQYSTDCQDNFEYLSVQDLIFACNEEETCSDNRDTCDLLNQTLFEIVEESWKVNEDTPVRGYDLLIQGEVGFGSNITSVTPIVSLLKGNQTGSYLGGAQNFVKSTTNIDIYFTVYN